MAICTRLIVLNTTPLGERSLVLHCLSREWGRRSFIVPAGKQRALYLPLSILDAEAQENPKSNLWRLGGVSAVYPLGGLRMGAFKNAIAMFMAEVLYRTVTDGVDEPGLFDWCEQSVLMLDALQGDYSNFHIHWLLQLCAAVGFSPSVQDMAPFAGELYPDIEKFLTMPFSDCMLIPLSGKRRSAIADCIIRYLSSHLEASINIRSLSVFADLF